MGTGGGEDLDFSGFFLLTLPLDACGLELALDLVLGKRLALLINGLGGRRIGGMREKKTDKEQMRKNGIFARNGQEAHEAKRSKGAEKERRTRRRPG